VNADDRRPPGEAPAPDRILGTVVFTDAMDSMARPAAMGDLCR
jgi:hypothetical protein